MLKQVARIRARIAGGFGRHVEAETRHWGEVIRKGNIKIEQ